MEVDEIQTQACKFSRTNGNDRIDSTKVGNRPTSNSHHHHLRQYLDDSDDGVEQLRHTLAATTTTTASPGPTLGSGSDSALLAAGEVGSGGAGSRLRSWQQPSRIIRVSRTSGGKDRHSKVWTAKGPRDRRVRLSVTTAIQFYDLQDRLGFDQPSKAVEWLIKAAADAIAELPALNGSFPDTPRQFSDEKRGRAEQGLAGDSSLDVDLDGANGGDPNFSQNHTHNQPGSNLSKSSACSSTSETSKGSGGLSLSRSEIRVKARERARERTAKEKDKETDSNRARVVQSQQSLNHQHHHHHTLSHQTTSSFTQLLTAGIGLVSDENNPASGVGSSPSSQARLQWSSPMDYFCPMGLMGSTSSTTSRANQNHNNLPTGFIQLGNSIPQAMMVSPFMSVGGEPSHPSELHHQHFPYVPDHHLVVPAVPTTAGLSVGSSSDHYNLNFSISSSSNSPGLAGFNNSNNDRGTLQSNSSPSSLLPHLQRFSSPSSSSPLDGSTQLPFFLGAAVESHQHAGLQLCYGDSTGSRHPAQKGKGKN